MFCFSSIFSNSTIKVRIDLSGSLSCLHYTLDVEQRVVGFGDHLKLVVVKRSFYTVTAQIFQLVSHGLRGHSTADDETFFRPVTNVSLLKRSSLHANAHLVTDLKPVSYTHLTLPTNREV